MPATRANQLAADIIAAIKGEIIETGRFTVPDFGAFVVRETPKRTALNPRTGEEAAVKAGVTVKFKASPALKGAALASLKKSSGEPRKAERRSLAPAAAIPDYTRGTYCPRCSRLATSIGRRSAMADGRRRQLSFSTDGNCRPSPSRPRAPRTVGRRGLQ